MGRAIIAIAILIAGQVNSAPGQVGVTTLAVELDNVVEFRGKQNESICLPSTWKVAFILLPRNRSGLSSADGCVERIRATHLGWDQGRRAAHRRRGSEPWWRPAV